MKIYPKHKQHILDDIKSSYICTSHYISINVSLIGPYVSQATAIPSCCLLNDEANPFVAPWPVFICLLRVEAVLSLLKTWDNLTLTALRTVAFGSSPSSTMHFLMSTEY